MDPQTDNAQLAVALTKLENIEKTLGEIKTAVQGYESRLRTAETTVSNLRMVVFSIGGSLGVVTIGAIIAKILGS